MDIDDVYDIEFLFDEKLTGPERKQKFDEFYIKMGLFVCGDNQQQASEYLGVSPRTIRGKITKDFPDLREGLARDKGRKKPPNELGRLRTEQAQKLKSRMNRAKTLTIEDLMVTRLKKTEDQLWFKQLPRLKQEVVRSRIRNQFHLEEMVE